MGPHESEHAGGTQVIAARKSRWKARPRAYTQHGLSPIVRAVRQIDDADWLDKLGPVGEALRAWRSEIISCLGGEEHISAQQRAVVEVATKTYLLLESVDRWLLQQPSLVNKTKHQLFAIVLQRQTLADSLIRSLSVLGLQRQGSAPLDLARALLPPLAGARNGETAPPSPRSAQNGKWGGKDRPGHPRGSKRPLHPRPDGTAGQGTGQGEGGSGDAGGASGMRPDGGPPSPG
jgi:hypothetical protein